MVLILDGNSEKCEHLYSVNGNLISLSPRLEHLKIWNCFEEKTLSHMLCDRIYYKCHVFGTLWSKSGRMNRTFFICFFRKDMLKYWFFEDYDLNIIFRYSISEQKFEGEFYLVESGSGFSRRSDLNSEPQIKNLREVAKKVIY